MLFTQLSAILFIRASNYHPKNCSIRFWMRLRSLPPCDLTLLQKFSTISGLPSRPGGRLAVTPSQPCDLQYSVHCTMYSPPVVRSQKSVVSSLSGLPSRPGVPPSQLCDRSCDPTMTKFAQWELQPRPCQLNRVKVKPTDLKSNVTCVKSNLVKLSN